MITYPQSLMTQRWRGERGRLEVWYTTITDPRTGTGIWIHHELVAPVTGPPARCHGWIALFPPDDRPWLERFTSDRLDTGITAVGDGTAVLAGSSGRSSWRLRAVPSGPPLFTFPAWSWWRPVLPAAQIVPMPSTTYTGVVDGPRGRLELDAAPGATARVHGRGHARRWAWLHADLGGGAVLEVVSAVSAHGPLRHLPPMTFLRLLRGGVVWPAADSLLCAPAFRADLGFPTWSVRGRVGRRRISVEVRLPPGGTAAVDYVGPDGRRSVCLNSERADAEVVLEERSGGGWSTERAWRLEGTAHAEVGGNSRSDIAAGR